METDKDHIWKKYPDYLRKHFWKEHTFWTDGYFVCSVGIAKIEVIHANIIISATMRHLIYLLVRIRFIKVSVGSVEI